MSQLNVGKEKIITSSGYDLVGNKRYEIDGNGYRTDYAYDVMNQMEEKKVQVSRDPAARTQTTYYVYDYNGNILAEVNWLLQAKL